MTQKLNFTKMNGAGNDFVVIDARDQRSEVGGQWSGKLSAEQIRQLSSRDNAATKGCDQLLILKRSEKADVFMQIYNADGSEVDACGNATRCIGWMIIKKNNIPPYENATIETNAGLLSCKITSRSDTPPNYKGSDALIEADMGKPTFDWQQIPLDYEYNDKILLEIGKQLGIEGVEKAICVGMGNPHIVFFVESLPFKNPLNPDSKDVLKTAGEKIRDGKIDLFKKHGINLTIAEIPNKTQPETIFSMVYERGAGITKSCGTAACATAVAAIKLGYREKDFDIDIQQMQCAIASLIVRWESKNDHIKLIGIVETEFEGEVEV